MMTLPTIWFFIICFELGLYVLLDGADLGIGMLMFFPRKEEQRSLMMQVVGPIWDANETWLVIAGGTLFGAFPLAYGVILNALYIPMMLLLFGLILRVASYEFHAQGEYRGLWRFFFGLGSLVAAVGEGLVAGGFASGIKVVDGTFAGGPFDWATPVTAFITAALVVAYLVMGRAYLARRAGQGRGALYNLALAGFVVGFSGIIYYIYPYIVPPSVTVGDAAAATSTLTFMLWGLGPLIPIVLVYNLYLYRVFRTGREGRNAEPY